MTEETIYNIIGKNIKKYRLLYSATVETLTQQQLANLIGVSVSLIGCLESKKVTQGISIPNLYKISKVLNVSYGKIF